MALPGNANSNVNMYRVGDYVYFESAPSSPYQIRKIEELLQSANGCVEARVTMFYRRRDLPLQMVQNLDREQSDKETDNENNVGSDSLDRPNGSFGLAKNFPSFKLAPDLLEHARLCEVFASTSQEVLQATHIRGKCHVVALEEEVESRTQLCQRDNTFYYVRKYDVDKKILRLPGERIRVGVRWQAMVPSFETNAENSKPEEDTGRDYECPVFIPSSLSPGREHIVDDFQALAAAVGLYARSQNSASVTRDSCLLTSAARAHRGVTKEKALSLLHQHGYDLGKAASALVANGRLQMWCDELEDWSPNEAHIFAQALEKNGKAFSYMKRTMFTWKEVTDIVAYYYFWKTTDQYAQLCQKQNQSKTEAKLKQVFIPQYSRINPSVLYNKAADGTEARACDSCTATTSPNWYAWGNPEDPCKLCRECWAYWKKYGGLPVKRDAPSHAVSEQTKSMSHHGSNGGNPLTALNGTEHANGDNGEVSSVLNGKGVLHPSKQRQATATGVGDESAAFPCPYCKLVLRNKNVLARHLLMMHPNAASSPVDTTVKSTTNDGHLSTKTGASTAPFSVYAMPWDRIGRRELLLQASRKVARRPFANLEAVTGVSVKACTVKGRELWKSRGKTVPTQFGTVSSALSVCERLMKALGLRPTDSGGLASLLGQHKKRTRTASSVDSPVLNGSCTPNGKPEEDGVSEARSSVAAHSAHSSVSAMSSKRARLDPKHSASSSSPAANV